MELLHTKDFWFILGFVIFVTIFAKKAGPSILAGLDQYIARIREEIQKASLSRENSLEALNMYKRKRQELTQETESILNKAKEDLSRQREDALRAHQELIKKREHQVLDKISLLEEQAVLDIRELVSEVVLRSCAKIFSEGLTEGERTRLIEDAVEEIQRKLN